MRNTGNANDTFTQTAPTVPAGFTVELSINGGTNYTTVSGGGSVSLPLAFGASAQVLSARLSPFRQCCSTGSRRHPGGIDRHAASTNRTIDRLYTGFVRLDKTATVNNTTGVGGATDAVPGAEIVYTITYTNIASTGGTNNSTLTTSNLVITEDGNAAPNNWGTTTDHVVGATDSRGGAIAGDAANSVLLTDTIATLPAGQSGTFTFKRRIK